MKCPRCGEKTTKTITLFRNGEKITGCRHCLTLTPLFDHRMTITMGKTKMGLGAYKEIRSRKVDLKSGETYQDTGRKIFT